MSDHGSDEEDQKQILRALAKLALEKKTKVRVLPPPVYTGFEGSLKIETFITLFENHCRAEYGEITEAWLQVLPQFLTGEGKALVVAFGLTTPYLTVRARLLEKFQNRSRLDHGELADIFSAVKRPDETYEVFVVRLEVLASRWRSASEESRQELVRTRFLELLDPVLKNKVQLHFGYQTALVPLQQIVDFTTTAEAMQQARRNNRQVLAQPAVETRPEIATMEDSQTRAAPAGARPKENIKPNSRNFLKCNFCNKLGHEERDCRQKQAICYNCRKRGHFARDCETRDYSHHQDERNKKLEDVSEERKCPACGRGGHAPWQCEQVWRRFLACQSCGSWEHGTFQCQVKEQRQGGRFHKALEPPEN